MRDVLDSVCRETVLHRADELPIQGAKLTALVKHIGQAPAARAARQART
jgi:hypothetical protein